MSRRPLLLAVLGLTACLSCHPDNSELIESVRELPNPALPGSVAPSLSATTDGKVILSWLEPADQGLGLRYSMWNGKTWSNPETVVRRPDFDVYAEAPPSVIKLANGILISLWGQKIKTGGKWDGSYLFSIISRDGGKHWSAPIRVHSDASVSEHSFSSIAPVGSDRAVVVWLDARDYETKKRYRLMSAGIDSRGTVSDERTVDEDTCTCCPTALVTTPTLAIAAYRGHDAQEIRDIRVSRLNNGRWETPRVIHDDNWHINGCPVNGPALSVNGEGVGAVWFTGKDDKPQIKVALSRDLGSTFQPAQLLDSPQGEVHPVGRTAISMSNGGEALAVWVQQETSEASILGQFVSASGKRSTAFSIARGTARGLGYPRLEKCGREFILSWGGGNGKEVKTAIISK